MSAYRSFARQKPTVALVVRARRNVAMVFVGLLMIAPLCFFVSFASVDCARDGTATGGTCRVRDVGALHWRTREVPLADLAGLRVDVTKDSDGDDLSQLVLVTKEGEIPLGVGHDNLDTGARRAMAARFDAFKRSSDPTFTMTTGFGGLGAGALWFLVCATMFAYAWRSARVVIDPANGAIRVRRWFRTVSLPLSREVRIATESDGEGNDVWYLVGGGEKVRLPQGIRAEDVLAFDDALRAALPDQHDA